MSVLEREPGTFACSGTFLDDPVLWGERKVRDDAFVVEVGSDGRTVTGSGESFYGRYDVEEAPRVKSFFRDAHTALADSLLYPPRR